MIELNVPHYFLDVLQSNASAYENFQDFSHTKMKDYVEWITEAKQESTRARRIVQAIEWITEGKKLEIRIRLQGENFVLDRGYPLRID